ncbi:MAG TPA: hypothetical protein VNK91_12585, partial [Burkholderiaceae bacterium]|nr:hypothetical protein [Burkholderiaceae bacterium]
MALRPSQHGHRRRKSTAAKSSVFANRDRRSARDAKRARNARTARTVEGPAYVSEIASRAIAGSAKRVRAYEAHARGGQLRARLRGRTAG